jgi:hypothetical protein
MLTAGTAPAMIDPPLPHDLQSYFRCETPAFEDCDPVEITGVVLERSGTIANYCQGIVGYVATAEEHPYGGYEPEVAHRGYAHSAPFAPETAQLLLDTSLDLLHGLHQEKR